MPNAINLVEKYGQELDQVVKQATLTNVLETPNVNWMGAQTFHVPTVGVTGYQDHSRNGGWNRGEVETTNEPYTLSFDRDVEFFVDRMDVDESNQNASAGNITRTFLNEKAGPEVDAYRFSKMATRALSDGNNTVESVSGVDVYDRLKSDILKVRKYGPSNLVAYLSSSAMDQLERSDKFTRNIQVQNGGTAIETRITSLDGVQLVEVWDAERFNTQHDFTTGFAATGQNINWIIVNRGSIVAKTKINSIYLFEPGAHTQGDGYLYQNRMYHDLFVMKNKADGIVLSAESAA
ncbi:hypothetical protein [Alkalibacillus almallahensis]|uniref:hypothetical protein n=1 Tax=Alkalibacillus almallahensis TaxID=1379154 RepID=UPI0014200F2D|nr:hypothetical protein [Alkalibacillus almallahensis]NIK12867.1 hypothetical protein [Alkalibacillus almallahensis]